MKKVAIMSILLMFSFTVFCEARVVYDSTGRKIVEDDTIRGRQRTIEAQKNKEKEAQAAAKVNYNNKFINIHTPAKSNFYQDQK